MLNAKNLVIALAFFLLVTGVTSLTVIVPAATFNPEPTPGLRPYTPAEAAGRLIYERENCYVCHSQFVRFQDEGVGPTSQAGDFSYDRVNLLGTLRNGPDLTYEGGLYPDEWHIGHLKRPRSYLPGSFMPSYDYLSDTDIRYLVAYIQSLGTRNTRAWETKDVNIPEKYSNPRSGRTQRTSARDAASTTRIAPPVTASRVVLTCHWRACSTRNPLRTFTCRATRISPTVTGTTRPLEACLERACRAGIRPSTWSRSGTSSRT
jgi:cytochrome c oxidase cbb3-type subunit II